MLANHPVIRLTFTLAYVFLSGYSGIEYYTKEVTFMKRLIGRLIKWGPIIYPIYKKYRNKRRHKKSMTY
jgi:hypothetical protein